MNNEQINEKIGEIKGYTRAGVVYFDHGDYLYSPTPEQAAKAVRVQHWLDPATKRTGALPDWAGSLDVAVTLMVNGDRLVKSDDEFALFNYIRELETGVYPFDKSPSRAVCLAYLKSQGMEIG